jgi:hypothetical protein
MRAMAALNRHEGNDEADSHEGELDPIERLRTSGRALEDSLVSVTV